MDKLAEMLEPSATSAASGDHSSGPPSMAPAKSPADEAARMEELMARAAQGDEAAATAVDEFFADPTAAWQHLGNLSEAVKQAVANKILGGSDLYRACLERRTEYQINELARPASTPLARVAAERLVLAVQFAAAQEITALAEGTLAAPATGKILELAERRVQLAMKSLQLVQRARSRNAEATSGPAAEECPHTSY